MSQLIEVGKTDKRRVTPLNKEIYEFAKDYLFESSCSKPGTALSVGAYDVSEFINELEKRYDITPKQESDPC